MTQIMQPIPTNLITGFLGVGKTTAIRTLLQKRQAGQKWSIFINEYGLVSIDHTLVEARSPEVRVEELGGGCFCCTTNDLLEPMLHLFIEKTKPDRLLIEPSGAGHPARVIDLLRSDAFRHKIDLRATISLLDPKDFDNPRVTRHPSFLDQIQMADIIVLNWLDKREADQVQRCRQWLTEFDPPKLLIAETQLGELLPEWLDLNATVARPPRFPHAHALPTNAADSHAAAHQHAPDSDLLTISIPPRAGRPVRLENSGLDQWACGWIFVEGDVFIKDALLDYLGRINSIKRVKGVFHCEDDWWSFNRVDQESSVQETAYRRDSRVEIIADQCLDWPRIERELVSCLADVTGERFD